MDEIVLTSWMNVGNYKACHERIEVKACTTSGSLVWLIDTFL